MAKVAQYDPSDLVVANRVTFYSKSVNTPDYSGLPNTLINPDLSNVSSVPWRYWKYDSLSTPPLVEMSAAEKTAYDESLENYEVTQYIKVVDSATYTLEEDEIIHVTYTPTGEVTITLPTSSCTKGRAIIIKDAGGDANNNNINIVTEGAETIDGVSSYAINVKYGAIMMYSDGSNWFIESSY